MVITEEMIKESDSDILYQAMVGTVGLEKAHDIFSYSLELESAIKDGELDDDSELETVSQEFKTRDGKNVRIEGLRRRLAEDGEEDDGSCCLCGCKTSLVDEDGNPCCCDVVFGNGDGDKSSPLCPTALRDKCNLLHGLVRCLSWVVDTKDFQNFHAKPHQYLIEIIQEGIEEIEKNLVEL